MLQRPVTAATPSDWLRREAPGLPVHFFAPALLQARLETFLNGFPGQVTYAVKANPDEHVLAQLYAGGVAAFDVASPEEIRLVRRLCPRAALHYNNPVRSRAEISEGIASGVISWSVDAEGELDKLIAAGLRDAEVAVRFKLPVEGAAYNFGSKFGATESEAAVLLARVAAAGLRPALTFHVGTQCQRPGAWADYIAAAARIARAAGVTIDRLNVGGGFPSSRDGLPLDLSPFFAAISGAVADEFGAKAPLLVCEPGRGLVADAFAYAVQVKSLRGDAVYLTDGIYGGLSEFPSMILPAYRVIGPAGERTGTPVARTVWGPTCDSLDRLPGALSLPSDIAEEDWILFRSMGAYLTGVTTTFNGYGDRMTVTVESL